MIKFTNNTINGYKNTHVQSTAILKPHVTGATANGNIQITIDTLFQHMIAATEKLIPPDNIFDKNLFVKHITKLVLT